MFTAMHRKWMKQPTANTPISSVLKRPQFDPFLADVIGVLDGTRIAVFVPRSAACRYRNRKGTLTMNVLAACTFDLRSCFVLAGWEGSASDPDCVEGRPSARFYNP